MSNEQILAQFGESLDELIKASVDPQYEMERLAIVNQARRNWHFVKGNHFLIPGMVDTPYGPVSDYVIYDGATSGVEENGANAKAFFPVNFIGGDCMKFMAVMGQAAPRVKAVADDPNDSQNIDASKDADAIVRDLWIRWRADQKQKTLAFHQYTTGPAYVRTLWKTDRRKYGQTTEPAIEIGPDGNPVELPQPNVYVNGDVEIHVYSVIEVAHSFMASELDECHWYRLEVMRPKYELLAAYGKPLEKYRGNDNDPPDEVLGSSNSAAEARESVASPSGYGKPKRPNHWRHAEHWFSPTMFEVVTNPQAREVFKAQFSDGMYLACVGNVKVDIDNCHVTDEWSVCKTGTGEKILEKPLCSNAIPMQRLFNDLFGLGAETILRAIAQTIVDSQLIDREAMAKKEPVPAEIILTALPVDGDINKRIAQIPPARMSDQQVPFMSLVRTSWQDITGIRPELTGGGDPAPTFRQEKQRRDQAMMQLSPQAHEHLYCWEQVGRNGVKMRAKYGNGTVKVPRKGAFGTETDVVDMARLQDSGWHTEADTNFPVLLSDRFDRFYELLKEFPPDVQAALSLLDPINLEQVLELLQIPGFNSTIEDQKQKTLRDISQLLEGQPVDGQPGPNGEQGQKQPSIPPDQFDDHAFVARFVPLWMISKTGEQARAAKPAGFENLLLWWQGHQSMVPPAQPQEPPVKASVSMSVTPEQVGPAATAQILQSAGLGVQPQDVQPMPRPEPKPAAPNQDSGEIPPVEEMPQLAVQ